MKLVIEVDMDDSVEYDELGFSEVVEEFRRMLVGGESVFGDGSYEGVVEGGCKDKVSVVYRVGGC